MPGIAVAIVNQATGETFTATSGPGGNYVIPLVKPGTYVLTVEAPGFKQVKQTGLELETGQESRVDVTLEVGEITETVTVEASAPLLKTENSSVGTVVRRQTIENMPLINRRAAQLARLSGFMVQNGTGSNFTMAGGRGNNAMWTIDGGNAQNILLGVATLNFDPPIEALEEFSVEVSNYKAELGRTGGGFVQMTTRSGTNRFHGSAYEFLRNDAFDARNFFSAAKPKLRYNQFGASLGGPIRRDQSFFFFNYEGIRNNRGNTVLRNVPTRQEVEGDFTGRAAVKDPLTGNAFPNNIIPASRLDPVGLAIARLYPEPNVPNAASRSNNFLANQPLSNPNNIYVARVDHNFTVNDRIYGRFLKSGGSNTESPIYPIPGVDDLHRNVNNGYWNFAVTLLHNMSPTTIMEARYTYDRRLFHNLAGGNDQGWPDKLGLRGVNDRFFPRVNLTGLASFGRGEHERLQDPIRGDQLSNTVTMVKGNHTWKFGWEFRKSRNDDLWSGVGGGQFAFNTSATGDALAALLLGHVNSASRAEALLIRSRANTFGSFVQTDWKVNQKLTLNLGLRWDLDWPRYEAIDNRQNSFDRDAINPVCGCPGVVTWSGRTARDGSRYAHNFDYNNFGPRVGFAYRPSNNWVIRGGGAIVYTGQYDQATPLTANIGFSIRSDFVSPDGGRTAAIQLRNGLPPFPVPSEADLVPGFGAVPIGQNPFLAVEFFEPENRPVPYLETFNFNIQRMLPWNAVFEIGYLGTMGHKLTAPGTRSINQVPLDLIGPGNTQIRRPYPQFSDVRVISPTIGNSNYHGVNFRLEKRYSSGLQFGANYTWSKLLDDVESRNELGGNAGTNAFANQYDRQADKGLAGNHIAHRVIFNAQWEMPVGRGRRWNMSSPVLNQILGGWSTGIILEARTGSPFGVIENNSGAIYPTAVTVRSSAIAPYSENANWRADVLGQNYFDTSAFVAPAQYTFGNLGRTVAIGPGAFISDLSILKDFPIGETQRLQFRTEMLNFMNHPNFGLPNQQRGNSNFGKINDLINGNEARIIQLGLHYRF